MSAYRYIECGLDNVLIQGLKVRADAGDEDVIEIPNINGLHTAISLGIVTRKGSMSGPELRFLRTEMGLTQAELGQLLHKDSQSVARWEKGATQMGACIEILVRQLAREKLHLDLDATTEQISGWCTPTAGPHPIHIDGRDPTDYHPIPQAA